MIWLNSPTSRRGLGLSAPALLVLPWLVGCMARPVPPVAPPQLLPPSTRTPQTGTGSAPAVEGATKVGLTPLPSARAVVASVSVGRSDPFLPAPVALAGGAGAGQPQRPPALPEGFRFQGVLRSAGVAQALVQVGADSGALRVGDRGGRTTDLLPAGWSVAAIDVEQGRLVLRQGPHTIKVAL